MNLLFLSNYAKPIYIVLFVFVLLPFAWITPAVALFLGLAFALLCGSAYTKFSKKCSKYLLQASVVGLGFGMNLNESLKAGSEGMLFTIVSVIGVMVIGSILAKYMKIPTKTGYLISSGTAICGGSAIAAVGPVIKADDNDMSVALGTIFILNAIALFIFPPIGHFFQMTDTQFGTWAAIAIHDTSSVVGAGAAYSEKALQIATLIKLTRALWIIPLAFATMFIFRDKSGKISIPWFIFIFVLAMIANTYLPLPSMLTDSLVLLAKKGLTLTLFLIGTGLSVAVMKSVGVKPMVQGVVLWIVIAVSSFFVIVETVD